MNLQLTSIASFNSVPLGAVAAALATTPIGLYNTYTFVLLPAKLLTFVVILLKYSHLSLPRSGLCIGLFAGCLGLQFTLISISGGSRGQISKWNYVLYDAVFSATLLFPVVYFLCYLPNGL